MTWPCESVQRDELSRSPCCSATSTGPAQLLEARRRRPSTARGTTRRPGQCVSPPTSCCSSYAELGRSVAQRWREFSRPDAGRGRWRALADRSSGRRDPRRRARRVTLLERAEPVSARPRRPLRTARVRFSDRRVTERAIWDGHIATPPTSHEQLWTWSLEGLVQQFSSWDSPATVTAGWCFRSLAVRRAPVAP